MAAGEKAMERCEGWVRQGWAWTWPDPGSCRLLAAADVEPGALVSPLLSGLVVPPPLPGCVGASEAGPARLWSVPET